MGFLEAIIAGFEKYFDFKTRASRSEYWYFVLFLVCGGFSIAIIELSMLGVDTQKMRYGGIVFSLVTFIPSISVFVRRLHDINKSGWNYLIVLIPILGWALGFYWACCRGTDGPNLYGRDPFDPTPPSTGGGYRTAQPSAIQRASFG